VADAVRVTGLKELRRALRGLEDPGEWQTELKAAGRAAGEIVAGAARQKASAGGTTRSGKHAWMGSEALATIRVLPQQTRVFVAGGSGRIVWYAGWEGFARAKQFPPAASDGLVIYPAAREHIEEVVQVYSRGIDPLLKRAFPG
jgi:hypothetical protein